ncbi:MAG: hypothetical protein GQ549_07770 [Gammaproteobacteria bacterium]|nr:hypothetical protein [Gammaproteobacteria bacterium]
MTGTACDFNEYSENISHRSRNFDLMSKWLFGRITTDCTLADISKSGCSILVPDNLPLSATYFNLMIMSPVDKNTVLMKLNIEKRWQDDNYSSTHKKIGARFNRFNDDTKEDIDAVISLFHDQRNAKLVCTLERK